MSLVPNSTHREEKAILVSLILPGQKEEQIEEFMDELAFLAETAGAITVKRFTQRLKSPDSATFIGSGKLQEIKTYVEEKNLCVHLICLRLVILCRQETEFFQFGCSQ